MVIPAPRQGAIAYMFMFRWFHHRLISAAPPARSSENIFLSLIASSCVLAIHFGADWARARKSASIFLSLSAFGAFGLALIYVCSSSAACLY